MSQNSGTSSQTILHNMALLQCREQMQDDMLCLLDGQPKHMQDLACDIIVQGIKKLEINLDKQGMMSYNEFCKKLVNQIMKLENY